MVPKAGNYFGWLFRMERGVSKGCPVSPVIFNVLVDAVIRLVLL